MYNKVIKLNEEKFRRKTGVKKPTFEVMVKVVRESEQARKKLSGRPNKLSYEDQVLMTLEYLREYRTYFSIGEIYEVSEANAYKIIKRTEDILIQATVENVLCMLKRFRILSDRYRNRRRRFGLGFNLIRTYALGDLLCRNPLFSRQRT